MSSYRSRNYETTGHGDGEHSTTSSEDDNPSPRRSPSTPRSEVKKDGNGRNHPQPPDLPRGISRGKTLGIKKSLPLSEKGQPSEFSRFDYEQKYPEDQPGDEASEYARVWLTYLDETEQYDRDKIDGWKDTIDVLMVLAGLFSAVVTTLVVQSSQNLQVDYLQVSAYLLFELTQLQRAIATNVPVQSIPVSPINPTSQFTPSVTDSVVNGLWFTSLALALSTALLAVLTKQWLYQYSSLTLGTPRERCRLRQFRYQGLEIWKVALIIELLPVLMHIALAFFLAGLVIFLIPLKLEVAWTIGVITGITYICYILSVLLPIWDPQCPYTIPLTIYLRDFWKSIRYCWHSLMDFGVSYESSGGQTHKVVMGDITRLWSPMYSGMRRSYQICVASLSGMSRHSKKLKSWIKSHFRLRLKFGQTELHLRSHREHEATIVRQTGSEIDAGAISWLYTVSSNPSVRRVTTQAIGGLPYGINRHVWIEERSVYQYIEEFSNLREFSALHVSTLRRLFLSWLHYESEEDDEELMYFPDYRKIRRFDPDFADICKFLRTDPARMLIQCLQGGRQEVAYPLIVWSYLFRNAQHQRTLAVALLTWAPGDNLFTWDDRNVAPVSGKEHLTLSGLSIRHPHIFGKWVFNYFCKYFEVVIDKSHSHFILLGKDHYIRYSLFKTIYQALSQLDPESEYFTWDPFTIKLGLFYLVRNFETYITARDLNSDDFGELCKAFEHDVLWSNAFFDDRAVVIQTRARVFGIYNILRKGRMVEPLHDRTIHCTYHYLIQADVERWVSAMESCNTALLLLSGPTLPKFCKFLCNLENPQLALVLSLAKREFTPSHAEGFVSIYKVVSRNPQSKIYKLLYDSSVLEELCKCMATPECSRHLYRIAHLDPFNSNWKDCYKRLLVCFEDALQDVMQYEREDIPPFYRAYRKEWFLLYSVCHHLRHILKLDFSGPEFALRELSDIFLGQSSDKVNRLHAVLYQKEAVSYRLWCLYDSVQARLIQTFSPAKCVNDDDVSEKDDDQRGQNSV